MRAGTLAPVGVVATATATAMVYGLCALCAWQARRATRGGRPYGSALDGTASVGSSLAGDPIQITWIGDSLAAGLGCDDVADTPAHLSAHLLERAVEVTMLAALGSKASDVIADQLEHVQPRTDIVVLCVGSNDVASSVARRVYATQVDYILTALAPTPVVMLTLPDMTMPDRMAQPLRSLAGVRARYFEAARARVAARHDHVMSVDIASRPGLSRGAGRRLLCADRFHPAAEGYRLWAERIATACSTILESQATSRSHPSSSTLTD